MIPVTVTFYGDVGFDRSYNHVIDFSNTTERNNYFSSKVLKTVQNCAYNKPMNSIQLKCNYEEALNFTYCKFIMGSNPSHRKEIYAWVDDVVLVTDQADGNVYIPIIQINISVDPWQTFLFDFNLGESFVVREHVDRFKTNQDSTYGWCLENPADSKSIGTSRRISDLAVLNSQFTFEVTEGSPITSRFFWLLIQKITTGENPVALIYFVPVAINYGFSVVDGQTGYYILSVNDVLNDTYLVKLGFAPNEIASVHLIPFDIGTPIIKGQGTTWRELDFTFYFRNESSGNLHEFQMERLHKESDYNPNYLGYVLNLGINYKTLEFERDVYFTQSVGLTQPNSTSPYSPNHEPQLFKDPYTRIAIIDEENIERGYLPDISANVDGGFDGVKLKLMVDTMECRLRIYPLYVDRITNKVQITDKQWCEFVLTSVDILSANWYSYLVQERQAAREMIASQINQQAIANAIGGVSGSIAQGGNMAISSGAMAGAGGMALGLGTSAISTVGSYLNDKHYAFEQQDIREKAIRMKANNVLVNGTFKSSVNLSLRIVLMRCDKTIFDIKSKEFHKYGYSVFKYETPNVKSRKFFNYIATNLVKIEGNLNNNIKIALMQIFNNGVTIWHGDYINELTGIGDYSKENIERSLI